MGGPPRARAEKPTVGPPRARARRWSLEVGPPRPRARRWSLDVGPPRANAKKRRGSPTRRAHAGEIGETVRSGGEDLPHGGAAERPWGIDSTGARHTPTRLTGLRRMRRTLRAQRPGGPRGRPRSSTAGPLLRGPESDAGRALATAGRPGGYISAPPKRLAWPARRSCGRWPDRALYFAVRSGPRFPGPGASLKRKPLEKRCDGL